MIKYSAPLFSLHVYQVCDAEDTDEGKYTCCVTKNGATDCAEVELQVLAVCDTDDEKQYTVCINTCSPLFCSN